MTCYVYILECTDGSFYTGSTKNLEQRLWHHRQGEGANYTKKRLPLKLVFCEAFDRIEDAFQREKQIQGWNRQKKKALIERNFTKLIELSKSKPL
jgi:putative endonuclease